MRTGTKGKITLLMLVGLVMLLVGGPIMTLNSIFHNGVEDHDRFGLAYTPHDAILLDGNAEMIALATAESWPGNGTVDAPYEITGYYFYDVQHSVEIRNIDLHWTFTNNEIDGPGDTTVWCGMEISNSSNGYVADNLFHNRYRGLWLIDIYDVTIINNTIEDNLLHGIECVGFINGCLISDNIITRNTGSGIRILAAVDSEISGNRISDCDGTGVHIIGAVTTCQIVDNIIEMVTGQGIHLGYSTSVSILGNEVTSNSGKGIFVVGSEDVDIFNNSLSESGEDCIVVTDCALGMIHNNTILETTGIGVSVMSGGNSTVQFNHIESSSDYGLKTAVGAENMTITRNIFINNGGASQVCDEGENNVFIYNYYDDWTSPDADSNQIVDTPYSIDGGTENEDPYPLTAPDAIPLTPTPTGERVQIPLELIMIAGSVIIIVLVGVLFVRWRA